MSLTVAFSTRKIDKVFIDHIKNTCGLKLLEILPFDNPDRTSLTEIYNKALSKAKNDLVVFCHDDIIFNTKKWGKKLLDHFSYSEYGILGVAGTRILPKTGRWWEDINHPLSNMVGIVNHLQSGRTWESRYSNTYGLNIIPVVMLDGLFFAVDKRKIENNFNEEVKGFDFYEVDFIFNNFLSGVKVGVITNVRITHKSIGQTTEEWENNRRSFVGKYSDKLPAEVPVEIFFNPKHVHLKRQPRLSIIIPTKDNKELLFNCIDSIIEKTSYTNYEIIVADTGSKERNLEKIKKYCSKRKSINLIEFDYYNFSQINNEVVHKYVSEDTELLLFCNNDIKLINDAISRVVSVWNRNKAIVGSVGARLHFGDNTLQHGGMMLWLRKERASTNSLSATGVTHHNFKQPYKHDMGGNFPVIGNTGAFLLIGKELFLKVGGFNPTYVECFEDVELNLSILLEGKTNIFVSDAVAYHYESKTRINNEVCISRTQDDYRERLSPFIARSLRDPDKANLIGKYITVVE